MNKLLLMVFCALFFVSCADKFTKFTKNAESFQKVLEAETGESYAITKLWSQVNGYVVYKNNTTGEYEAYNVSKWDRKNMTMYSEFLALAVDGVDIVKNLERKEEWIESGYWETIYEDRYEYDSHKYYDRECDCYEGGYTWNRYEVGSEWRDTSGYRPFYYGGGFRFDNSMGGSKDLETLAAMSEEAQLGFLTQKLTSEFSLSANRANELAKLATRYQKLENVRALTSSEKDHFALEALGASYSQVESAMRSKAEGELSQYNKLLEEASKVNNTTPEQMGRFFEEIQGLGL